MGPRPRPAGVAGILAGVGLAAEFTLFMTSGWTPATFGDPASALALLRTGGAHLRAAAFVGVLNLALYTLLVAGLAAKLHAAAPTCAAATLYLGLVGIAAHGLVPLGLWLGVPMFLGLAARDYQTAFNAWGGFAPFIAATGGLGYLFDGLSLLAAGWAIASSKMLPRLLGLAGLCAGLASAFSVLAAETPLDRLAGAAYLPALLLTIAFRLWAGYALWRGVADSQERIAVEMTACRNAC